MKPRSLLAVALFAWLVAACDGEPEDEPYIEFAGGGFIFNFRIAEAYYGFVVRVVRKVPDGTVLEARFENPSGGAPYIVRRDIQDNQFRYAFETPPVEGVEADRDYHVELRLLDPAGQRVIAYYTRTFRSEVGQEMLPKRPLTTGPGYQRGPDNEAPAAKDRDEKK